MEYSAIPALCEHLIHRLTELSEGDYGMEDTVILYEALNSIRTTLNNTAVRDRRPQQKPVAQRLGGCAIPTILKNEDKPHYINIWKF